MKWLRMKVRRVAYLEVDLEDELEELDLEYCLPYWFWTKFEWTRYQTKRRRILKDIERRDNECSC